MGSHHRLGILDTVERGAVFSMGLLTCTPDSGWWKETGIHEEPGRRREKLAGANEVIDELLEAVVTDLPYAQGQPPPDDQPAGRHPDQ